MTNIANNLTFYRKKNALTQGQLGEILHVSAQAISKWETGQAEPGLDVVLKLAQIYEITVDELLTAQTPQTPDTAYETVGEGQASQKKPSALGRFFRKFWYIPVIVILLAAAITVPLILLNRPTKYGRMIENEKIVLNMTEKMAKDLLGKPTDTVTTKDDDWSGLFLSDLDYDNATYFAYYDERKSKNDEELWFGVEYQYLRLVFDEKGELIEAFYNNTGDTEVFSYGDMSGVGVESFKYIASKKSGSAALICFEDGSVYLGKFSSNGDGSVTTPLGTFDIGHLKTEK